MGEAKRRKKLDPNFGAMEPETFSLIVAYCVREGLRGMEEFDDFMKAAASFIAAYQLLIENKHLNTELMLVDIPARQCMIKDKAADCVESHSGTRPITGLWLLMEDGDVSRLDEDWGFDLADSLRKDPLLSRSNIEQLRRKAMKIRAEIEA